MRESPISCDTLLVIDAEYGLNRRLPKILLEFFMRQSHNDLIPSPDDRGLLGARNYDSNDVIISDTMLRSLAPPQLRPMTDHHRMM